MRLPRRILALGAHPDDLELLCAGTLARYLLAGCAVELAVACQGDKGGLSSTLAQCRRSEAEQAASLLGVPIHFLDIPDATLRETRRTREAIVRLIRTVRPELLLTHGPNDYHADHVRLSKLAAHGAWYAASEGHRVGIRHLEKSPALVYMDNIAAMRFEPTHLVDITDTFELKRRMLDCHQSQHRRTDGGAAPLGDLAETLARLRGLQCGVTYAEAFQAPLLWGRRRPEPLFP
jgi:LmbE family N-acetylglucosaminyl deacetylase